MNPDSSPSQTVADPATDATSSAVSQLSQSQPDEFPLHAATIGRNLRSVCPYSDLESASIDSMVALLKIGTRTIPLADDVTFRARL
jgi:hypothetical protein